MKGLKKEQIKAIVLSSICIIFGMLFCILPSKMMTAIEVVVCATCFVYGVVNLLIYCLVNSESRELAKLLKGTLAIGVAILLMFVGAVFVFCLGLIIVLSGVLYIVSSIKDRKNGDKKWWLGLIIGIALSIAGLSVAILFNTKLAQNIVMVIFGITLIADGVIRLLYVFVAHKELHAILSKIQENSEENIEPEFEVKSEISKKVQNESKNEENPVKKQTKINKNTKNSENDNQEGFVDNEVQAELKEPDDDDNDDKTEGFV